VEEPGTRLLVKVAQLYHLQGLNQDHIARQVGVSRSKVSRMLKEARERGLVEISIHNSSRFSLDLERQLESDLRLREAVVVTAGSAPAAEVRGAVARAGADYLVRVLQPGDILGISGGETVTLTAQVIPSTTAANVSVVQLGTSRARALLGSCTVAFVGISELAALDLNELRNVPLVVGVASGSHKAAAILAAVRGGYVKSLVTDDATATEILRLARPRAGYAGAWLEELA
jgi:DNA-binding transcriptional regulator LsrR (DeoR family)